MITYSNRETDTCMHALGDGTFVAGIRGLDLYQLKGADLAGRSCLSGRVTDTHLIASQYRRLRGRLRYAHEIFRDGMKIGTMEEYISTGHTFVRDFCLNEPVSYTIMLDESVEDAAPEVFRVPKGSFYVNDYPTGEDAYFRIAVTGGELSREGRSLRMRLCGKVRFTIRLGNSAASVAEEERIEEYNVPCPETDSVYADIIEDYWYLYQCYHSAGQGLIGAIEWNLDYIRDAYGAMRGLLAAGMLPQVREHLAFYLRVFREKGFLATAQSVGKDGSMHIHECDEAENPGYLVLEAFAYYEASADREFLDSLMPMLRWCMEAQARHIYDGMMPYCGDETYVAGGILPRVHLEDGSCEATMLFIESARRMGEDLDNAEVRRKAEEARALFRRNFWRDGNLITNNPARKAAPLPETKKGPCVYCYGYFAGLRPNKFGLYTCRNCAGRQEDITSDRIYCLPCVAMEPAYFGTDLVTQEEQRAIYERYAESLLQNGIFSTEGADRKCTGYEYGLLLYGLVKTESPLMHPVHEEVLRRRDGTGVWAEYYRKDQPCGMRYRLWESGVNLMALLAYEAYLRRTGRICTPGTPASGFSV